MTAHTANENFAKTVRSERKITAQILKMILDFEDNKYHIELGYSSLFDWLTKGHGYDEGSANRRIQAARAMRAVPEVEQKLQDGKTTMTNLVRVQSIFRHAGQMSREEKREVIESIEGQTTAEATQTLFQMFPEAASKINQDRRMIVDEEHVRYAFNLNQEQEEIVARAKELLSHRIPNGSMAEIMTYLAAYFVERNDPLFEKPLARRRKSSTNRTDSDAGSVQMGNADAASANAMNINAEHTYAVNTDVASVDVASVDVGSVGVGSVGVGSVGVGSVGVGSAGVGNADAVGTNAKLEHSQTTAVASKRRVTIKTRREVIREAGGRCEYVDPITKRRCDSRVRAEVDHIRMRVFGGSNDKQNLRCLCRVHNQFMSERNLGRAWANRWRSQ